MGTSDLQLTSNILLNGYIIKQSTRYLTLNFIFFHIINLTTSTGLVVVRLILTGPLVYVISLARILSKLVYHPLLFSSCMHIHTHISGSQYFMTLSGRILRQTQTCVAFPIFFLFQFNKSYFCLSETTITDIITVAIPVSVQHKTIALKKLSYNQSLHLQLSQHLYSHMIKICVVGNWHVITI